MARIEGPAGLGGAAAAGATEIEEIPVNGVQTLYALAGRMGTAEV